MRDGVAAPKILAMPQGLSDFLEWTNLILTAAFTVEMVVKMLAYGLNIYFKSLFNMFDCLIVIASLIEITAKLASDDGGGGGAIIGVFRIYVVMAYI